MQQVKGLDSGHTSGDIKSGSADDIQLASCAIKSRPSFVVVEC